jgi:hypothetical protein
VSYERITRVRRVRTHGGGESPKVKTIVLALDSGELKMTFTPRKATAILGVVTDHTGSKTGS